MLPYWLLFLVPAIAALHEQPTAPGARKPLLISMVLLLSIMIGLRYQVGGDWGTYAAMLHNSQFVTFFEAFGVSDPGYALLNWLSIQTFQEIWVVNLICGFIFSIGLIFFVRNQPRTWLALLVAVPYLVIVVAMGYTRQGVAIGLAMIALVVLERDQSNFKFILCLAFAASFHKTAVALVPMAAFCSDRGRIWTIIWVAIAGALLYYVFLDSSVASLQVNYIEAQYQSQGAAVRVAMNAVPAFLFLAMRRHFKLSATAQLLWTNMAWLAIGFILLLIISPSSTAVDRMALYIIPLQIFVFSRLPEALSPRSVGFNPVTLAVVGYSAAVQFVWLTFGAVASEWLPYQFYPLW